MRNVTALMHENSFVDKKLGVTYKGHSLQEIKEFLPRATHKGQETEEPVPEALFHLFLTGRFAKAPEMARLRQEVVARQSAHLEELKGFV